MNGKFENIINTQYSKRRDSLSSSFVEAFEFLNYLEKLSESDFHLGTYKNLHLYYKDSFLFYLKITDSKNISIRSKQKGDRKKGTFVQSDYFFDVLMNELVISNSTWKDKISEVGSGGYTILITRNERVNEFFQTVKRALEVIEKENTTVVQFVGDSSLALQENLLYNYNHREEFSEGSQSIVQTIRYKRSQAARIKCLEHWGYECLVCSFNFEHVYGKLGRNFIHVHHEILISESVEDKTVDPINDLKPVCPNCHAMIHKQKEPLSIDDIKKLVGENEGNIC